jgi:hypothetical protein
MISTSREWLHRARTRLVHRSKQALYRLSRGSVVTSGFAPNYQIQSASVRSPLAPSPPLGWRPYAVRQGDSRGIHRGTLARKSSYWAPNF